MSKYRLKRGGSVLYIKEREWGTGPWVQFTKFTSCIGVLSKVKGQDSVVGVHLGMMDGESKNAQYITAADAAQVLPVLKSCGYDPAETHIVGCLGMWRTTAEVKLALERLLKDLPGAKQCPTGDVIFGAKAQNGQFEFTSPEDPFGGTHVARPDLK